MTPEEKAQLDRVERTLNQFLDVYYRIHFIDKDVYPNPVIFNNDVTFAGQGGTSIGNSSASLLSFYGVTPVDQPATISDPSGGTVIDTQSRTAINTIIDRLQELGLVA